jgi:hypothetical protein
MRGGLRKRRLSDLREDDRIRHATSGTPKVTRFGGRQTDRVIVTAPAREADFDRFLAMLIDPTKVTRMP